VKHVIIIAEAGVNHNGSLDLAKKLVDAAADAKADFIKFQTFKAETLVTEDASKAEYQITNTGNNDSQFSMLKKLEFTEEMHDEVMKYCKTKGVRFLSTPFDITDADYLEDKVSIYKVPSGELTNFPLLSHLARKKKPIIISTGMATLDEIRKSISHLKKEWDNVDFNYSGEYEIEGLTIPGLSVLHCTTAYPTPFDQVNLKAMTTIEQETMETVGYSDHTLGIEVPIAATAMGARIIEKHFTLDRNMEGPDHAASLEPNELKAMVLGIRNISSALGTGIKAPSEVEKNNIDIARKSVHFRENLSIGHVAKESDFVIKRPGSGIPPYELSSLVGKELQIEVKKNQIVEFSHFK